MYGYKPLILQINFVKLSCFYADVKCNLKLKPEGCWQSSSASVGAKYYIYLFEQISVPFSFSTLEHLQIFFALTI